MKKILGISVVLCLLVIAGVIGWNLIVTEGTYYTQVDNTRMKEINPESGVINFEGSLPYRYTLPCYNKNGKEKELSFTAGKELREGAFLALEVSPIRGVVSWGEVQYDELPEKVQVKYVNEQFQP